MKVEIDRRAKKVLKIGKKEVSSEVSENASECLNLKTLTAC